MTKTRFSAIVFCAALGAALAAPVGGQQRVSIYTAHTANIVEVLIPEFEKATGIKADVVKAGSGDIINRVRAESANPKADVIWSIGAELLEANTDLLEPYTPKERDDRRRVQDDRARGCRTRDLNVFVVQHQES
jgi:iron(III) transport system substrate-binding protein